MTKEMITRYEELGAKRWQKAGFDRLYINAAVLGLRCEEYKSGNIKEAYFQDERISNSEAAKMQAAKVFIDVATGELTCSYMPLMKAAQDFMARA